MEDLRASADLGVAYLTAVVIATRGQRLVLIRGDARNDERPEAFQFDVLQIVEINGDDRIVAVVSFDLEDIGAAIKELDARYLAGEAAPLRTRGRPSRGSMRRSIGTKSLRRLTG